MASKVFAGVVVAFWLTMMVALVRLEFYAKPVPLGEVATERVLQKVFANREPARMNVYYQKTPMGFCRVEVTPLATRDATPTDPFVGTPQAYLLQTDLDMRLAFFGTPSRFHLVGNTRVTPRYEIIGFRVKTMIGEGRVDVQGDDRSKKVNVMVDLGETHDTSQFDFEALRGGGLASVLGVAGLANVGFPVNNMLGSGGGTGASSPTTVRATEDQFVFGEISQRAYLVEIRSGDAMWAKVWVSSSGEVLFVDTSMGVTMVSDLIDSLEGNPRLRVGMRGHRSRGQLSHDPN